MPMPKPSKQTYGILAAVVAGLFGADQIGVTPDFTQALHSSPLALLLVAYIELRIRPLLVPISDVARRSLGLPAGAADIEPIIVAAKQADLKSVGDAT